MRILLITGGDSSEREVSFMSANGVRDILEKNGHKVLLYDLLNGYESIVKLSEGYDVLFPVLHGEEGEGGRLHKFLSKIDKPIAGTRNFQGMSEAWHKLAFKKYCDKNGIKTSDWKAVNSSRDIVDFGFPSVFKTSSGGSSKEIFILKSENDLEKIDKHLLMQEAFVERFLPGVEITVGILNDKALPVLEIVPVLDDWFSYRTKYDPSTKEIPFAPSVSPAVQEKAQEISLRIHQDLNLGSYSRMDFIVSDELPIILEVNTIPGLTPNSLIPKAAKAAGFSFGDFLEELLKTAS